MSGKGLTYFRPWGFSINEGGIPNIHVSWKRGLFVYLCWGGDSRWSWASRRWWS